MFRYLNTCRLYEHGPIPWTACYAFAQALGLSADSFEMLLHAVRGMDEAWTQWKIAEAKKKSETGR